MIRVLKASIAVDTFIGSFLTVGAGAASADPYWQPVTQTSSFHCTHRRGREAREPGHKPGRRFRAGVDSADRRGARLDVRGALRDPKKPPPGITKRHLREQYVRRGRSSQDLAAELGLRANTIRSWCRRYNLPVRAAGPRGHRSALYPTEAIPPELRPVLTGSRPWKRLVAFMNLRDHPTMRATAAALRIDPKNLARDIRRLERELGQQLVHHSRPPGPITGLTEHGYALATAIATALEHNPGLARTELTLLPGSKRAGPPHALP